LAAADRRKEAIAMIAPPYVYETLDLRDILNLADLMTAEKQLLMAERELAKVVNNDLGTLKPEEQKKYRVRYAEILLWSEKPEKYARAQEMFTQLVKDYPDDTVLPLRLAQTYLWSKDYPPALTRYTALLSLKQPNKADALANVEIWRGFVDSAAAVAGTSLRESPRSNLGPLFSAYQRDAIFKAYLYITTVQKVVQDENAAELEKLRKQIPATDDPIYASRLEALNRNHQAKLTGLAESMGRLGLLLGLLGDREKSSGAFGAALAIDQGNRDVWLQYAQTLTAVGDDTKAKAVYDYLITLQSTAPKEIVPERPLR
jgi:tetratricopeptide (TPR) repeat protein